MVGGRCSRSPVTISRRGPDVCTMIVERRAVSGSGKAGPAWFSLGAVHVSYDHPFHAPLEHALNLDFVNEADGPGARVAVELTPESARRLVEAITATLDRAEAGGYLEGIAASPPPAVKSSGT